jgi:hypothetical protein
MGSFPFSVPQEHEWGSPLDLGAKGPGFNPFWPKGTAAEEGGSLNGEEREFREDPGGAKEVGRKNSPSGPRKV